MGWQKHGVLFYDPSCFERWAPLAASVSQQAAMCHDTLKQISPSSSRSLLWFQKHPGRISTSTQKNEQGPILDHSNGRILAYFPRNRVKIQADKGMCFHRTGKESNLFIDAIHRCSPQDVIYHILVNLTQEASMDHVRQILRADGRYEQYRSLRLALDVLSPMDRLPEASEFMQWTKSCMHLASRLQYGLCLHVDVDVSWRNLPTNRGVLEFRSTSSRASWSREDYNRGSWLW